MTITVVAVLSTLTWVRIASERSSADAIWGERWQLVRVDVGDAVIDTGLVQGDGEAIVLNARHYGHMSLQVCNQTGGEASVVDGHIELGEWMSTMMDCGDPLDSLVTLGGASIDATSKRLVLTTPSRLGGPIVRTTWVPATSIDLADAIAGQMWSVTEVRAPDGERQTTGGPFRPAVSLLEPDRVLVKGCGTSSKRGRVTDGRIEVAAGPWTVHPGPCESAKAKQLTPRIKEILDSGAVARRDGQRLRVHGQDGSSFAATGGAGLSAWTLFDDPHAPSTARWVIADVYRRGRSRRLVGAPVLTARVNAEGPRYTVAVSGCVVVRMQVTELEAWPSASTFVPIRAADDGDGRSTCTEAGADQAAWMSRVLGGRPEVRVAFNRAEVFAHGSSIVLVRLD